VFLAKDLGASLLLYLGLFRPEHRGIHGRFELVKPENVFLKVVRVAKNGGVPNGAQGVLLGALSWAAVVWFA
jgi:hypothetical protein